MSKPPLIRAVRALPPATLEIAWSTGETLPVDVSRLIQRYRLYSPLRNTAFLRKAAADDWGHLVRWPGNVYMGADRLYPLSREQAGQWGPESFAAWMEQNSLSLNSAADALDMTRRMIAHYRSGSRPIPRVVSLACEAVTARHSRRAA